MNDQDSLLSRFLVGFVEIVCRRPITVLVVAFTLAAMSVYGFCNCLEFQTSRSELMSPDKDYQRRWREYLAEFGDEDDMVVVVRGTDQAAMRAAVDDLAARVAQQPDHFDRIFARADLTNLKDRALLFLPVDQLQAIRENLDRMGPLLSTPIGPLAWRSLTLVNLLRQARERAGRLDPETPLAPADEQFLSQLLETVRTANAALADPKSYKNPWGSLLPNSPAQSSQLEQPQYFFSGDGRLAFLLVHPVKQKGSFTPAQTSVDALRIILATARPKYPNLELGLTGLPVLETDEMAASNRDANLAGWYALGGTALLYFVVYRGLRYPFLTVAALLTGTAWAMGWLTITVGHLNILSAAFAVMIIGLGDYGVLWVTHYEQRRRQGDDPAAANRDTASFVGPSILFAALTTSLAFFAAMLADFRAVAELGWIAGCGVMFCAIACFTVLPALIGLTDRRGSLAPLSLVDANGARQAVFVPQPHVAAWLPSLTRRPRAVLIAGLAVCAFAIVAVSRVKYDHNLLNMQAAGLDSVKWEHELIESMAGASWHAISHVSTPEQALALKSRYEQLPGVSRVVEVASLIPADQPRKLEIITQIRRRLSGLPAAGHTITPMTPPARELQKEATFLLGALQSLAPISKHALFEQLVRGLVELRDHPAFHTGDDSRDRLRELETRLAGDLLADLHRLKDVATPKAIALTDLPACLRERFIGQTGRWQVQAYAKDNLWDIAPLARFVAEVRTVDPEATGKPFGTLEGLRAMQSGFIRAGLYAFVVIVGVLAFDFRSVKYTGLAFVPLAVGVVVLLGVMGMTGHSLNPANMIALPLIVGVGVDNGVHVLHDFRHRRRHSYALAATTGKGIMVSGLTTVLGFGTLMISNHRGLAGLGFVLALGVTTCMVAALVLLPALLRLVGDRRARQAERRSRHIHRRAA